LTPEPALRVACVHVLPVEYYPPAMTMLEILASNPDWSVRVWTTENARGQDRWDPSNLRVERPRKASTTSSLPVRTAGYLNWHLGAARAISAWNPHVVISVEPHSALATWIYYKVFNGKAGLFIHHHEHYAPEDFNAPGMRLLRATRGAERDDLFHRALWISQTNEQRLRLLMQKNPTVPAEVFRVFPNFPPKAWIENAKGARRLTSDARIHFLYLGSASLEDTFIGEAAAWIARHQDEATLTIVGNNIAESAWSYVRSLNAPNISTDNRGWMYDDIPRRLADFDIGLVLYRGNTQNFIFNVPNKVVEYLAAGLAVWYPREMTATAEFQRQHSGLRMSEIDFSRLPSNVPLLKRLPLTDAFPFTAESAVAALVETIGRVR
jgi:hypothetical protein